MAKFTLDDKVQEVVRRRRGQRNQVGAVGQVQAAPPVTPQTQQYTPEPTPAPKTQPTTSPVEQQLLGGALRSQQQQQGVQPKQPVEPTQEPQPAPTTQQPPAEPTAPPRQESHAYTMFMNVLKRYREWRADPENREKGRAYREAHQNYDSTYAKRLHGNTSWHPDMTPPPQYGSPDAPIGTDEHVAAAEEDYQNQQEAINTAQAALKQATGRDYRYEIKTNPDTGEEFAQWSYSEDGGQTWVVASGEEYKRVLQILGEVREIAGKFPSVADWLRSNTGEFGEFQRPKGTLEEIENLRARAQAGEFSQEIYEQQANRLGFATVEEMDNYYREQRDELPEGLSDPSIEGLSDADREVIAEADRQRMLQLQQQAEQDIDAIYGETGSAMRAFQMADYHQRQMSNVRSQQAMAMLNEDTMRRHANLQWRKERFQMLENQRVVTFEQAKAAVALDADMQIHALSLRMQAETAHNQTLLSIYSADRATASANVGQLLAVFNAELGLDNAIRNRMDQAYEQNVQANAMQLEAEFRKGQMALERWKASIATRAEYRRQDMEAEQREADRGANMFAAIFTGIIKAAASVAMIALTPVTGGASAAAVPAIALA